MTQTLDSLRSYVMPSCETRQNAVGRVPLRPTPNTPPLKHPRHDRHPLHPGVSGHAGLGVHRFQNVSKHLRGPEDLHPKETALGIEFECDPRRDLDRFGLLPFPSKVQESWAWSYRTLKLIAGPTSLQRAAGLSHSPARGET